MTDLRTYLDSLDGAVVVGRALLGLGLLWAVCAVSNLLALHGRSRR